MNVLEEVLKNSKTRICIKRTNGNVEKVLLLKAHNLVTSKDAIYISKSEYKKATNVQFAEDVVAEVVENSAPKPKLKAKERKAAARKK